MDDNYIIAKNVRFDFFHFFQWCWNSCLGGWTPDQELIMLHQCLPERQAWYPSVNLTLGDNKFHIQRQPTLSIILLQSQRMVDPIPHVLDKTTSQNVCKDATAMMRKSIESCALLAGCHPNATLAAIQRVAKTLCQITGMKNPRQVLQPSDGMYNAQFL